METTERLQRVLAARGIGSRRKAEDLIRDGRVRVDGEVVTELGVRVDPSARIDVDGRPLRPQRLRYIALNKPSGYITTTSDERGRHTVLDLVDVPERVYPVGRLDRDTDGLLLLTNDGDVANRVMHPRYGLTKEYNILTTGRPPEWALERVRRGIVVDGKRVQPETFRILRETHGGVILTMTIHEGMNRVVRKMMDEAGIPVARLRRVRIGPLSVAGIPVGAWRDLTSGELGSLLEAVRLHEPEQSDETATNGRSTAAHASRGSRPRPTSLTTQPQQRARRDEPKSSSTPNRAGPRTRRDGGRRGAAPDHNAAESRSESRERDRSAANSGRAFGGRRGRSAGQPGRNAAPPSPARPQPTDDRPRQPKRKDVREEQVERVPLRPKAPDNASRSGGKARRRGKPHAPQPLTPTRRRGREKRAANDDQPQTNRTDDDRS